MSKNHISGSVQFKNQNSDLSKNHISGSVQFRMSKFGYSMYLDDPKVDLEGRGLLPDKKSDRAVIHRLQVMLSSYLRNKSQFTIGTMPIKCYQNAGGLTSTSSCIFQSLPWDAYDLNLHILRTSNWLGIVTVNQFSCVTQPVQYCQP